jgi:hypothetical protein
LRYGISSCICVKELFSSMKVRIFVGGLPALEPGAADDDDGTSDAVECDVCDGGGDDEVDPDEQPPTNATTASAATTGARPTKRRGDSMVFPLIRSPCGPKHRVPSR